VLARSRISVKNRTSIESLRMEAIGFVCSVLLARVTLVQGLAPFGTAFLAAAAIAGMRIHFIFIASMLGALLIVPIHMPAIVGNALFYTVHLIYHRCFPNAVRVDSLIILFVTQAILLPIFYIDSVSVLLHGLIGLCLCIFSSYMIQKALQVIRSLSVRHVLSDSEQVSISVFFGILLLAVSEIKYMGFSLAVILLLVFSMIAALAKGIGGVAVAVAIGAVLTVGGDFTLMFVGSLAACTLAGAALRKAESFGVFAGFLSACLIVGSYVFTAAHTVNLPNLAIAGLVFLTIPKNGMLAICGYLDADKNRERYSRRSIQRMRQRTSEEMDKTTAVCRKIASIFEERTRLQQEPQDAKEQWMIQAAANVCIDCAMQKICWKNFDAAAISILALVQAHERGERIRIRQPFDPSCKQMVRIAAAAWQAKNQYSVQHAMQMKSAKQYAFVNRQLSGICDIMERLSKRVRDECWIDESLEQRVANGLDRHGIRCFGVDATYPQGRLLLQLRVSDTYRQHPLPILAAVRKSLYRQVRLLSVVQDGRYCVFSLEEAQLLTASVGMASCAVSDSGVSGDCTGIRSFQQGKTLYVLSDGMGSGSAARSESESAIRLLFDLYEIGFSRDIALECVNKMLLESCRDTYATLDAVYIDLTTGQTEFIKFGAPPAFISRGGKLHLIQSEALPAGIVDEAVPAIQTTKLRRDDAVFLFSDGVLDALGEQTQTAIRESLAVAKDSQTIADALLDRAMACGQEDDMTVMVIRIA